MIDTKKYISSPKKISLPIATPLLKLNISLGNLANDDAYAFNFCPQNSYNCASITESRQTPTTIRILYTDVIRLNQKAGMKCANTNINSGNTVRYPAADKSRRK